MISWPALDQTTFLWMSGLGSIEAEARSSWPPHPSCERRLTCLQSAIRGADSYWIVFTVPV
jgi:hypothetical protein